MTSKLNCDTCHYKYTNVCRICRQEQKEQDSTVKYVTPEFDNPKVTGGMPMIIVDTISR